MKKIFLAICILFLSSLSIYADLPEFEGGTVISLNDYSQEFKDNIILVNYSGLNEIDIESKKYAYLVWDIE